MKNTSRKMPRRLVPLFLTAALLLGVLLPGTAAAQSAEELTRYLPASSQGVVGLNISKLSKSKYYKNGLAWLRKEAAQEMKGLEDAGFDLSKDLEAIVISMPSGGTAGSDLAAILREAQSGKVSKEEREFTAAISGSFDRDKLVARMTKENGVKVSTRGKNKVYSNEQVDIIFPAKGVMWVSGGEKAYRKSAFATLGSKKKSVQANKAFKKLLGEVNTAKGFWMVASAPNQKTAAESGAAASAQAESMGLSVDIHSGLDFDGFIGYATKEQAKNAVAEINQLKSDRQSVVMLSMFGGAPLLSNLKITQDGKKVDAATEMTASEFDTMVSTLLQMAQSQLQGGGMMPSQPVPNKAGKSGGADADFN